jgi:hypothetical protein
VAGSPATVAVDANIPLNGFEYTASQQDMFYAVASFDALHKRTRAYSNGMEAMGLWSSHYYLRIASETDVAVRGTLSQ